MPITSKFRSQINRPRSPQPTLRIDPKAVAEHSLQNPDSYWKHRAGAWEDGKESIINFINQEHPLELVEEAEIRDNGSIIGMVLSPEATILVTFSNFGIARLWDLTTYEQIQCLKDAKEENIGEFYVGKFVPGLTRMAIGGKVKQRNRWSAQDEDNHVLPCPLKIFDVETGEVVSKLAGHEEEILCVKAIEYKGDRYFVTSSQDGYIIRWKMDESWRYDDGITCMAFTISFLPRTGNRLFIAATDEHLRLYDFEAAQFISCVDLPAPPSTWKTGDKGGDRMFAYLISRGVEEVDEQGAIMNGPANSVKLHKLIYPSVKGDAFELKEIRRFMNKEYCSNVSLIRITSNGRYVAAPTFDGAVVFFNLESGQVTGLLADHEGLP
ncbi:WD40-repeat-containing domain protein [Blyttiomyces helicus]|uniref:WD40-repeat-containing domain protein n=1 Tax=Blyttiomyces helicus TaxID=388810 RepID=A0A4P9W261_9FUNG|nr:WD40-repeat-containing domain protein [Blyttiomyces helicus]|eukprot:RKO84670.1 WD40-repeat-containing domain protein [Blyttiomyces helicus]